MIHRKTLAEPEVIIPGCYIAGGSILSIVTKTPVNDYDVYPKSQDDLVNICSFIVDEYNAHVLHVSKRAITFKSNYLLNAKKERMNIQVILLSDFDTPETIFKKFDFTVCMAAYDCDTKEFIFHPYFYEDVASRKLNVNVDTDFPYASLNRISKYEKKGYSISQGDRLKLGLAIAKRGMPEDWESLEEAIGGFYGKQTCIDKSKEYNFDNAIEALSNVTFIPSEDTTTINMTTFKNFIKTGNNNFFKIYFGNCNNCKFIDVGNGFLCFVDNDVITNILIHSKSISGYYAYSLDGLKYDGLSNVLYDDMIMDSIPVEDMEIKGFVVYNSDEELLCVKEPSNTYQYRRDIVFIDNDNNFKNVLFFTELEFFQNIKEANKELFANTKLKILKATCMSSNIKRFFHKDVFVVDDIVVIGV